MKKIVLSVVAALAFRLPDRLKVKGRLGKWLLRRWLATHGRVAEPYDRKRGFTVPVGAWLAARGHTLGPLIARQPGIAEVCLPGEVERLFSRIDHKTGEAAWLLLFYALWHQRHIGGVAMAGEVADCLAVRA